MAIALEEFVKQLEDSGIISRDKLQGFLPPNASPKDAEELARELVRRKTLTRFQAEEVYRGKGKSLVLGNYVLFEKIGAGGMGEVFKAEHRRMKRIVAIKMLPKALMKGAAAVARFQREVEAASKLLHPNIVSAFDADLANGIHFLVMEYVEGADLYALVRANGPLSVETGLNYILQAAKGLAAAHAVGIVHRDIKPANLLLDNKGTVKILDMGLARLHSDDEEAAQAELTATGMIMGTVDFMAPEQALNSKVADARADIYSLGCTLYYLLTGKAVFDGNTLMARLLAHREQPIPLLQKALADVPDHVEAIFQRMVAKKIEDRYQTMMAVITDLEQGFANSPPTSVSTQQWSGATRERSNVSVVQNAASVRSLHETSIKPAVAASKGISKRGRLVLICCGLLSEILLVAVIVRLGNNSGTPNVTAAAELSKKVEILPADFDGWMKHVATLSAEEQVVAVAARLRQLNPGFDGHVTNKIENGAVTAIQFVSDHATDISPVRALIGLENLGCFGSERGKGQLADLTPLKGMRLTELHCHSTKVADLSPLEGMPLTILLCNATQVSDLSPLKGMKLKRLNCGETHVSDLSPLKDMNLMMLACYNTQVSDLSPLQGMHLHTLFCRHTKVSDFSPLSGMHIAIINFDFKPHRDTRLLRSLKALETINEQPAAEFWREVEARQAAKKL